MPKMPGQKREVASAEDRHREREALIGALEKLEQRPWDTPEETSDGFVMALFGGSSPAPRALAEDYLRSIGARGPAATAVVRQDLERSLTAAWQVAYTGREATRAIEPVPADLRTIEAAIVEARQCRLVYSEALDMLARNTGTVQREEIRRVKDQFNEAILELGRTADALSARLEEPAVDTYASRSASTL